ncbi:hypothetical protein HDU99_001393 [Rhizoclosmatium hyalinum]|nr:hypothetical protein HDU99_001393 [Rhizoclosmatium hyalinum]
MAKAPLRTYRSTLIPVILLVTVAWILYATNKLPKTQRVSSSSYTDFTILSDILGRPFSNQSSSDDTFDESITTSAEKSLNAEVSNEPYTSYPQIILEHNIVYIKNKSNIVAGNEYSLLLRPNESHFGIRQGLYLMFEHEVEWMERQFLYPTLAYRNGDLEFTFKMFVPGTFKVTLFYDSLGDLPWKWSPGFMHLGAQLLRLGQFQILVTSVKTAEKILWGHLALLPHCTIPDLENLQHGRILSSSLFPATKFNSKDSGYEDFFGQKSPRWRFLPDNCQLHYFSNDETNMCLRDRNVTFLGDSTVFEAVSRLMYQMTGRVEEDKWTCPKSTEGCPDRASREMAVLTSAKGSKTRSWVSHVWSANIDACWNGPGAVAFKDKLFVEWTKFRITEPEFCHHFEESMGYSFKTDWKNLKGAWVKKDWRKQDTLVYSTGLHDLVSFQGGDYKIEEYGKWVGKAMQELGPLVKHKFILSTNPQVGLMDIANRHINNIARKVAKEHGFQYLDQNGIQLHRLKGNGEVIIGDTLHGKGSDFGLAVVQLYLNAFCPK